MSIFFMPQQETAYEHIAKSLGEGLGSGINQGISDKIKNLYAERKLQDTENNFIEHGLDPQLAKLAAVATVGGQTEAIKYAIDELKRQRSLPKKLAPLKQLQQNPEGEVQENVDIETPNEEIQVQEQFPDFDEGLTPAERVKRQGERYKAGLPVYQEAGTKLRGYQRDKERLDILEKLNHSGKLPKSIGRVNVDKEGNLRFPFLSSPESQRFIKTLNEFSSGAKDTFGSRVTNFDLQQYLLRYPTLLNSSEGRKQLLEQMRVVNEINQVYYKNLKNVIEDAGGVRNIDIDTAENLAEKRSQSKIDNLAKKFDEIGNPRGMPSASQFKGKKIRNPETGEVLQSDGNNWVPVNR